VGSGRFQTRWRLTRLGLVISAVALAAGAAAIAAWPHAWPWVVVITAVIAAGAPAVLAGLAAAQQRQAETAKAVRQGLQGTTGPGGDVLPLAAEADLDARVHRAVLELPYIHRDVEDQVRRYLADGRPVLLVGSSMVGKTKMAATLIQAILPARRVVIPDTREALASLDAADVVVRDSVIFLDDINRLIGSGGITDGALRHLVAADNIIIGTIRAGEYDRFQPTDQLRPPEWDVLSVFERVFIGGELSDAEQQRLAEAVHDPDVQGQVRRVGLGEYVGAAEHIAEALRLGPSVNPTGYALVLGAADWQRVGMTDAIPASVLRDLAAPHLQAHRRADLYGDKGYQAGLAWATRDINPTVALLQRAEPDTFTVYDYALDLLSDQTRPIPDTTWPILIEHATPMDLVGIGYAAQVIFSQSPVAKKAWSKAAKSGDADAAPVGAANLGILMEEQGNVARAQTAFRRAIDSGHADAAPRAAFRLGMLLSDEGDMEGAKATLQRAIDSGHAEVAPAAVGLLGIWLAEEGDAEGAKSAYRWVIDVSDTDATSMAAAVNLGVLLAEEGDVAGAKAALQRAIDSGQPDMAPKAAVGLGDLLKEQGDIEAAKTAYRQAMDSGHADAAPRAAFGLGVLLIEHGDTEAAKAAFQQAIDSGHSDIAPAAMACLGAVLIRQEDMEGAQAALQQAIDSGHAEAGAVAAAALRVLLDEEVDVAAVEATLQQAIDSGHVEAANSARQNLKTLRNPTS
jgi:tetratricopeptide (TPR) repeat protein